MMVDRRGVEPRPSACKAKERTRRVPAHYVAAGGIRTHICPFGRLLFPPGTKLAGSGEDVRDRPPIRGLLLRLSYFAAVGHSTTGWDQP